MDNSIEWKCTEADAVYENTGLLADFVEKNLPDTCPVKAGRQIAVAFDEIYSNIVKYSGAKKCRIKLGTAENMVYLQFEDDGIPYNPIESAEPDINASNDDRLIGGLGLYMVKKTMDFLDYSYIDDHNCFVIGKNYKGV